MKNNSLLNIALGPVLCAICFLFLPDSVFTTPQARMSIGLILWMSYWWVTTPVDLAITSLLPIVINAIYPLIPMPDVISKYSSEIVILLLGASILSVSWVETGLDKRIALSILALVGNNFRKQLLFWFLMSMILSAVINNSVVVATVVPVAVAMLTYIGQGDISKSKLGSKLLLTIVFAITVGGLATPLGGAMNLVCVDYFQQVMGKEYIYNVWVIKFLPVIAVLLISHIIFLFRNVKKEEALEGSREYFQKQFQSLPKMSWAETWSFILFIIAVVLSFTREFYKDLLPELKPAYVFIFCAMLTFFIKEDSGKRLMVWKNVQKSVIWDLLFLFAGGLALGAMIQKTGAAQDIGNIVANANIQSTFVLIFAIMLLTFALSAVTSNTATAAISLPIVVSVTQGLGLNPIPYIYAATIGINLSYLFPTSIRSVPVGYGLSAKYLLSEGWKTTVITIILMTVMSAILLPWWAS